LTVVLVTVLAVILNGISFIVRLGRKNRQADGCFVLTDELATFVRNGEREFSLRWPAATQYLIRRISHGRWRVRLSSRVASVDVIIAADKRTIAALRAELKARTGHIGIVGWGTSIRRNVVDS